MAEATAVAERLSKKEAEKLLTEFLKVDEGNETIITDIFTRFGRLYPEHKDIRDKIWQREYFRPFWPDQGERISISEKKRM